ncbi:hypothetical protein HDU87_001827 [Geranomyces variabilis]|uniref:Uncharacterized protein n=1 Tax=Geranomyces variabilis TaxID=109894 RepID=A0AAD5TM56_9FUNG|nr:hypothetical protein HDU87_001827 [Geranomyces variabilis]
MSQLQRPPPPPPPPPHPLVRPPRPPQPQPQPQQSAAAAPASFALALLLLLAAASSPAAVLAQAINCRQAANVCIQNSTTTATVPFDLYAYSGNFAGANIPTNPKQWDVRMYAGDLSVDKTPLTNPCAPPSSPLVQTWVGDTLEWEAITPSVSKVSLTIDNSDALKAALAGTGGTQGFFFSVGSVAEGQCTLGPNITPYTHLNVVLPPVSTSSASVSSSTTATAPISSSAAAAAATGSSTAAHPLAATTLAPTDPNAAAAQPPPPQSSSSSSSASIGMIAGIAVGATAFIALIIACLVHRRNQTRKAWGLEHGGSRSIGAAGAGLAAATAGGAAAAATSSKNKNNSTAENASLARLVHGTEGQSLRAATPDDGGAMSPDEIRVGSFGSRASFDRRNNAEALSLARSSNNLGGSFLPAAAPLGAAAAGGAAAASSSASSSTTTATTSDVENAGAASSDASPRSTNPFLDPPAVAAAAAATPIKTSPTLTTTTTGLPGQSKNRGSIMATMNQPYRSLPRPSSSDSLSSTDDQDATNPFLPTSSSSHAHDESHAPLVNPFATAAEIPSGGNGGGGDDHRHRMAQMIANAYRKGLSDEQTHWYSRSHLHPTTTTTATTPPHHHVGEVVSGGEDTAKEVAGLRRVDDGRHASAATLPGLDGDDM